MNKIVVIALFTLVSITWGTTWIAMKIATETIPPFFATGLRFLLASPVLIILSYLTKSPLLFPSGQRWFQICVTVFYFSIPFTLILYGGAYVSSTVASMIFSNMPVVVLLVSHLYLKKKLFVIQKVGICISFFTLCILLLKTLELEHFYQWKAISALILALFLHAMIYAECQKQCCSVSVLTFNALPSLISGIFLCIISWLIEQPHYDIFSHRSIVAVLYLSDFSGIFGILSYFYLQKKVDAFYASMVFVIFPFISGAIEYYFYQYRILSVEIWCIFPLILGILLTLLPKNFLKKKSYTKN